MGAFSSKAKLTKREKEAVHTLCAQQAQPQQRSESLDAALAKPRIVFGGRESDGSFIFRLRRSSSAQEPQDPGTRSSARSRDDLGIISAAVRGAWGKRGEGAASADATGGADATAGERERRLNQLRELASSSEPVRS